MNNNVDEGRNKLKKPVSNAGFFSLTLPAAFQRVFKKQSPSRENTDENYNNNGEEIDNVPTESTVNAMAAVESDQEMMMMSSSNNAIDSGNVVVAAVDDQGHEFFSRNNHDESTQLSAESVSPECEPNSTVINELSGESSPLLLPLTVTGQPEYNSADSSIKTNCLNNDDQKASQTPPLKGILSNSRNNDSLDSSQYSSSRIKKNVSFNVTVLSEQYAPPSLFYEERSNQMILKQYLKACEKYKIKPLDKVVCHINEFSLKSEREIKIDLKGCRLDYKQCECLEEVFRYVRTQWLDISNTFLEDDGCTSICEICEYYDTATHICLSGNTRISNRGWISVSQLIQKSSCLEYLDLSRTIFTEQMLHILVRAFRTVSSLKILHLEGCYLNGARLQIIMSAISSNKNIRELYLAENKISSNDASCLFDLLVSNDNIKVLDLRNNSLQDNGLFKLSQGLLQQTDTGVEVLHLWNNSISSNGIQGLIHVLSLHPSLHTLNLGRNKIGDEGILIIKFNLIKNKHLQRLGLSNNRITNTGAVALAELIADSSKLLRLDLRENNIGLAGLIALSQAMQVNYSVFKLDFNRNIKVEPEMADLVSRLIDDIRICCLRNRQLAKGGPLEEIISLTSVLSDDHSITESLKTLPPNEFPSPQKSVDGTISSFWQILSKFTKAKNNPSSTIANIISRTDSAHQTSSISLTNNTEENSTKLVTQSVEPLDMPSIVNCDHETNDKMIHKNKLNETKSCLCDDIVESKFEVTSLDDILLQKNNSNGCVRLLKLSSDDCSTPLDRDIFDVDLSSNHSLPLPKTKSTTTRFSSTNNEGGIGRFSITRVVEKYHYKPNYPIGTNCEDTSSTDKSYEIHQDIIIPDCSNNNDHSVSADDNICIHAQQQQLSSTFIDSQTENQNSIDSSIKQSSDE